MKIGAFVKKKYVLEDSLGSVRVVISDEKLLANEGTDATTIDAGDYFMPKVVSFSDTYPFGMSMRSFNPTATRYGFIGQENDNEISGTGNSQDHMFRQYDTRLGRYKSLDPLSVDFPWNSPYAYAENRVIDGYDLEGREWENFLSTFSSVENLKPKLPNINEGEVQLQTYKTVVSNSNLSFKGMKDLFTTTPEKILSNDKAEFKPIPKEGSDQFKLEVGANIRINIDLFMNNSFVRVTKLTSTDTKISATFTTLEGHVEAGVITFSIEDLGDGKFAFTINGVSQVDYTMVTDGYAREQQAASWFEVLQNFIDVSGGSEKSKTVNVTSQTADSDGGEIKEVSISRKVKKGNKEYGKQAKETRKALEKKKGG